MPPKEAAGSNVWPDLSRTINRVHSLTPSCAPRAPAALSSARSPPVSSFRPPLAPGLFLLLLLLLGDRLSRGVPLFSGNGLRLSRLRALCGGGERDRLFDLERERESALGERERRR